MLDTLKLLLANQFEAAFCTIGVAIDRCPDSAWNAPVAKWKFCQAAFHALFFADVYLGKSEDAIRDQPFHREHPEIFRDYEELEPRAQVLLYDRSQVKLYLDHCRAKARDVLAAETAESLAAVAASFGRTFSRAELHVYNIRHVQHHAAQLMLRLRLDHQTEFPWIGSGWKDLN